MQNRVAWIALLSSALLSLAVAYGIATESVVVGSRAGGWVFPYSPVSDPRCLIYALIAIAVTANLAIFVRPGEGVREWIPVLLWLCAAQWLQGMLHALAPFSLDSIFLSESANSYYSVTTRIDAGTLLARFEELRPTFPSHAHSNMPGKFLFLYGLELLSQNPRVLARLVVTISNLGGVLLYLFVRDWFGDRKVALNALALYLFVPARLFFFPLLNTVTPVPMFLSLWLWLRTLERQSAVSAFVLGIAVFGLGFFEPVPFVTGLLGAAMAVRSIWCGKIDPRRTILLGLGTTAGFALSYAIVFIWTGFDWFVAFRDLYLDAMHFHDASDRDYWTWVIANPWEFFFGVGTCQAVLFVAVLWHSLHGPGGFRRERVQPIGAFAAGCLASLVALDLSGVSRGEVIRIWIFLACLLQVPAAYVCAQVRRPIATALVLGTTVLQAAVGISKVLFLIP